MQPSLTDQEKKLLNLSKQAAMQSWHQEQEPTFKEWLLENYDTTPVSLRILCRITAMRSSHQEYEALMEWYRRRYRKEMETRRALMEANPFTQ